MFGNDVGSWYLDVRVTGLRPKRCGIKSKSFLFSRQLSILNLNLYSKRIELCPHKMCLDYTVYLEDIHGMNDILRIKRIRLKLVDKLAYLLLLVGLLLFVATVAKLFQLNDIHELTLARTNLLLY